MPVVCLCEVEQVPDTEKVHMEMQALSRCTCQSLPEHPSEAGMCWRFNCCDVLSVMEQRDETCEHRADAAEVRAGEGGVYARVGALLELLQLLGLTL